MNNEIIPNQIQGLLETIQEQYEAIRTTEGRIPQIEFDILLDNIRKVYDQLHHYQKLNIPQPHNGTTAPLPHHSVPRNDDSHQPTSSPAHHLPTSPPSQPHNGTTAQPSPRPGIKSVERPKAAVRKEEEAENKAPQVADMDLFAGEEPTFNMKLKEAREMSLPQKAEPVGHLKELISINDKFIFINELFDGNLKEYNEAVETLNGFSVKTDAFDHLDLLRKKNLWELGSGTFMKLKEIVERKY